MIRKLFRATGKAFRCPGCYSRTPEVSPRAPVSYSGALEVSPDAPDVIPDHREHLPARRLLFRKLAYTNQADYKSLADKSSYSLLSNQTFVVLRCA